VTSIIQTLIGILFGLIQIAMFTWFCSAIGSAFESDKPPYYTGFTAGDIGAFIGLVIGVAFSIYWMFLI